MIDSRNSSSVIFSGNTGAFGSPASRIAWILGWRNCATFSAHLPVSLQALSTRSKSASEPIFSRILRLVIKMPHHPFENCQRIQFDSWIDFTLNGILRAPQINSAPCDVRIGRSARSSTWMFLVGIDFHSKKSCNFNERCFHWRQFFIA